MGDNNGLTDLIKRCQAGDSSSYSELYHLHRKKALGTAYLIFNQKGIAEDIVQESFIECFRKIETIKDPEAFEAWFYKILMRTGWKMVKSHNSFLLMNDQDIEGLTAAMSSQSEQEISETNLTVQEALAQLSLPLKTVVILYYFNDLTIEEIARVLGCFPGTVKSRLFKARKKLHNILDEDSNYEPAAVNLLLTARKEYGLNGNA